MWIGFTWLRILLNGRTQCQVMLIIMHIKDKVKGDRGKNCLRKSGSTYPNSFI
jgi:hypothetical protein